MWHKDVKKGFGFALKQWRSRSGISQEELAWRAGLHRSYVADIERGARNASLQTIEKLARALKVSLAKLFEPLGEFPQKGQGPNGHFQPPEIIDILLVEDDPADLALTLEAFTTSRLTNRLHVARDGAEALDFLFCKGSYSARKPVTQPQVVLLDLMLPKVSGLEVLRSVKGEEATRDIPVVVLTASRNDEHVRAALSLGA